MCGIRTPADVADFGQKRFEEFQRF